MTGIPLRLALPLVAMRCLLISPHKPNLSKGAACCGGGGYLDEFAGFYVVDIAVDGDGLRHERARADAGDIGENGLGLIFDGEEFDELGCGGAGAFA